MIQYSEHTLPNGLRVFLHQDTTSPMAGVSLLYNVGSRDEKPTHTGYAHLFEHLMFSGTPAVPNFDDPLQMAGGENNAYTTNDYTMYHEVIPAVNLDTALWLESDRMQNLRIKKRDLEVQRKVVLEEFQETCFQEPYGDLWHHLSPMAFGGHPYEWPVIGSVPEHIANATLEDVKGFYERFYAPNNAILAIASPLTEAIMLESVQKWFGNIAPSASFSSSATRTTPPFRSATRHLKADVPLPAFFLTYPCPPRLHPDFYLADLITDVLADGPSSRLICKLVKERAMFSQVDAYLSDTVEGGIMLFEGNPADGVTIEQGIEAIRAELEIMKNEPLTEYELQKVINRHENSLVYSENSVLNKSQNMCYYAWLGAPELLNTEIEKVRAITPAQIQDFAKRTFTSDQEILLTYETLEPVVISKTKKTKSK
jgi:zinc protease